MDRRTHYLSPAIIAIMGFLFLASGYMISGLTFVTMSCIVLFQIRTLSNRSSVRVPESEKDKTSNRPKIFSSLDELASGIAHEINNPLAIIAQEAHWAKRLLNKILSPPENMKDIKDCTDSLVEIENQVYRCNQIVQKLLSMARELNIVIQNIDINELVKGVYEIIIREVSTSKIKVNLELDPKAPRIDSDAPLIQQVLLNIVMNAKQACGEQGKIDLRTKFVNKLWVEIEIQDDGCGIPKENLDRIFLPFFSTKQDKNGTGLGLAICRGIVEKLGGSITLKSGPDEGTLFTVRLPLESQL
ncbi:MAG: ATP-binding protein [Pseudomonadota bacterium]